jgi:hypothetical protein
MDETLIETDSKETKLEQLLELFTLREISIYKINNAITKLLAPTMLLALVHVVDTDHNNLAWESIDIVKEMVVLQFSVTFNPATTGSEFLKRVDPSAVDGEITKSLRLAIPLELAFSTPEEIVQFLTKLPPPAPKQTTESATEPELELTQDQVNQMLFFQQQTKGIYQ